MKMRANHFNSSVIEALESRRLLSAVVSLSGSVLTITGDSRGQNIEIYESYASFVRQTMVSIDADGNGSFADAGDTSRAIFAGVETLVTRLGLGDDRLSITLADPFIGATRSYDLKTGAGNDIVRFTNPVGNDIRSSNVSIALDTAGGNDQVTLALNRISASTLQASINTGAGNDTLRVYGGDDVASATVDITAQMGTGNDFAETRLDLEGFDLVGASSVWKTNFFGGDGDDILSATGELGTGNVAGTLSMGLFGDVGNDQINFALGGLTLQGGKLQLRGNGFSGNDRLSLSGNFSGNGVLDIILSGNGNSDILTSNASNTGNSGGAILDGGAGSDVATTAGTLLVQKIGIEG